MPRKAKQNRTGQYSWKSIERLILHQLYIWQIWVSSCLRREYASVNIMICLKAPQGRNILFTCVFENEASALCVTRELEQTQDCDFEYFSDHTKDWIIWQNLPGRIEFVETFQVQSSTFVPFSLETSGIRWHEACKYYTRWKNTPTSQKIGRYFSHCILRRRFVRGGSWKSGDKHILRSTFQSVKRSRSLTHRQKIHRAREASQAFQCILVTSCRFVGYLQANT